MECRRGLAMRILSVCRSVRLSATRMNCDKTVERSVQIFIPYERSFSLVFWEESLVGATPSTWNFGSTNPRWSKFANFQPIFARSSSAVTSSEKSSINANRKSTTRFPMSLRWSSYIAPKSPKPKGVLKTQNGRFPCKIALRLKTVCYKVFFVWKLLAAKCKAFTGLAHRAKIIGGATPCTWNFGLKWPRWSEIADFRFIFARSASAVTPVWKLSAINCRAFIGLTIRAKMIGGGDPFYLKFWVKVTALEQNRPLSIYFRW